MQFTRMAVLEGFRKGQHHVLVATDVAARGLDIKWVMSIHQKEIVFFYWEATILIGRLQNYNWGVTLLLGGTILGVS